MEKLSVLVVLKVEEEQKERFRAAAPGWDVCFADGAPTPEQVQAADVLLGTLPQGMLQYATRARWLQCTSAGVDDILKSPYVGKDVAITNISGAFGQAISECMLAYVLMLYKKYHLYRDNQRRCEWKDMGPVRTISNATVLVVGLGDIGGDFAVLMKKMGAYVIGVRRSDTRKPDYADELYLQDSLDDLLPRADIVALALPGTAQTVGMFNAERIAKMKEGAILINVGRGTAVDSDALCAALRSGKLSGAAADVTDPEPLSRDHPLWQEENFFLTPHVTGYFHLRETYLKTVEIFVDNLTRYYAGQPLRNLVDRDLGYRKEK